MDGTVLIADDDRTIRTVLSQALTRAGCKVHATSSLTTLMRWVGEGMGDAIISDVVMPDGNGLEMLPKIAAERPGLPVIIISAQNTVMTAIRATEAEAWDYLPKPFDLPDLMARTARALDSRRSARAPAPEQPPEALPLVGQSAPMQALFRDLARVINSDLPVWIAGESGTGKSLVARVIHDVSDRRRRPFVTIGPGDLAGPAAPAQILDRADAGTIVLDGLQDFTADAQLGALMLIDAAARAEAPPRLIGTAQNADDLRSDLYYRLAGAVIDVPPLRERREDIPLLATHFLFLAEETGAPARRLAPAALDALRAHDWPGNLRELEHAARRLALSARVPEIARSEVDALLAARSAAPQAPAAAAMAETLPQAVAAHVQRYFDLHGQDLPPAGLYARVLREVEAPLLRIALDSVGGNQAKCAELLGINRNTLRKKMTDLDIEVTRRRKLM
ncbi:response regulator [Roseovarius nanhaiticus]|uniref:response regulator n=1 Tax=Roseovarius nanhaiticus TaxID=573024 RepID=UPI0024903E75|nr:response regulator [Roseovarius nanhaiticus]